MWWGRGDYVCHYAGVGYIETEVVTHGNEFLIIMFFSEVSNNK